MTRTTWAITGIIAVLSFIAAIGAAWWHINTWPTSYRLSMIGIALGFAVLARIAFTRATAAR